MSTELATIQPQQTAVAVRPQAENIELSGNIFNNPALLDYTWRVAKVFAGSKMVPAELQGQVESCIIALDMARSMGENPLIVCQNIHFINGKAGWKAEYMVNRLNKSGLINGRLRWTIEKPEGDIIVTAHAVDRETGEVVESTVSLTMAKAEGWTRNSKYGNPAMAEHMLKWRSAAFLIRLNYPDVMAGMSTADELEDVRAANTLDITPPPTPALQLELRPEPAPAQQPRQDQPAPRRGRPTNAEIAARKAAEESAQVASPQPAPQVQPTPAPTPAPAQPAPAAAPAPMAQAGDPFADFNFE